MPADRLAHPPLDTVTRHGSTEHFSHRQTDARPTGRLALQEEHRHAWRKVPPPLLVHALKVGMLQKPGRLGKCSGSPVLGTAVHVGFQWVWVPHSFASFAKGWELGIYSRKPGFTETRLRPLARRRDSTACPLLVFIRERKPCFFTRLRRLGWNVRFGMETHELLTGKMALRQTLSIKDASSFPQLFGVLNHGGTETLRNTNSFRAGLR